MIEVLLGAFALLASCFLGWCLGVRRERGRQLRLEEIRLLEKEAMKRAPGSKGGVRLRSVKIRR